MRVVASGRVELPMDDYQSSILPLNYEAIMVAVAGFEPAISALSARRFYQLSYTAINKEKTVGMHPNSLLYQIYSPFMGENSSSETYLIG